MNKIYTSLIETVRADKPLIHHITNYVTVNDCANITLAIGASPIMADALAEAGDIAKMSSALVLNMGTLNESTISSMISAGKVANSNKIPIIFDPVGAGSSALRNKTAALILNELRPTVLCGNISEIKFLTGLESKTKGVDASDNDVSSLAHTQMIAKQLANRFSCIVAITGAVDVVSDGKKVICIENGHPMLDCLTGTGCMCSSLIGSLCGAVKTPLEATVTALLCMGIAGETAFDMAGNKGNGSFHTALHDVISKLNTKTLERKARLYEA